MEPMLDPPDLDAVVAAALAEDLRRHLSGKPIEARPDGPAYIVGKFVRRHRAMVAAMSALVLTLAVGTAAVFWQSRRAVAERDRAEEEASGESAPGHKYH